VSRPEYEDRVQALMSRVVDGDASGPQWEEFQSLAEQNPTLWRELAEYQRDHAELGAAVGARVAVAAHVEAPVHEHITDRFSQRLRLVGTFGGWAAAAAVALVWGMGQLQGPREAGAPAGGGNTAGLASTPTDLLQRYLAEGRARGQVVQEMPEKVMIDARPAENGGYDIYYMRQIIERANVPSLYTIGQDEHQRPVPVPVRIRTPRGPM
jgi:hypothetical protein